MRKSKQEISSPKPDQVERPIPAKIYPAIDTDPVSYTHLTLPTIA